VKLRRTKKTVPFLGHPVIRIKRPSPTNFLSAVVRSGLFQAY